MATRWISGGVEAITPGSLLRLRAEMKLPGLAWFELAAGRDRDGMTIYSQRAIFEPRGLAGHAYWRSISPLHGLVSGGMLCTSPQPPSGPAPRRTSPRQPGTDQRGNPRHVSGTAPDLAARTSYPLSTHRSSVAIRNTLVSRSC